ncbi:CHRD domain-containing protein [soil metagenome]
MNTMLRRSIFAVSAALLLAAAPALADTVKFKADLKGAMEVPAADSKGTGAVDASYDTATKALTWTITYADLSGATTAAHFHGPADVGKNAPPVVPIPAASLASPIKGTATLTDAQAADLQAGKWYFNVHSAKFPDGEIRGQVTK